MRLVGFFRVGILVTFLIGFNNIAIARFIEPDPIGLDGGPNRFAYVGNNPVNRIDPWGLDFITPEQACLLMQEFQTWLGTPYKTGGITKGPKGGTDCSHSTREGYTNAGFPYTYSRTRLCHEPNVQAISKWISSNRRCGALGRSTYGCICGGRENIHGAPPWRRCL